MPALSSVTTVRWSPRAARAIRPTSSSVKTSGPATLRVPRSGAPTLQPLASADVAQAVAEVCARGGQADGLVVGGPRHHQRP